MYLAICDDQKSELEAMQLIVSDYAAAHPELSITVQCFLNPSELLDAVSKNGAPDIALLDICMPGVLGTDVAKELKEKKRRRCGYYLFNDQYGLCSGGVCAARRGLSVKTVLKREADRNA